MPSPAIFVAVLALVAALAGTALAGTDATTSAISKKKVKKLVKKEVAKQVEDAVGPQGPPGERGPQGQNSTKLFAAIHDTGSAEFTAHVVYGRGVTAVDDPTADTLYTVTFNRSVVNCVVLATPGHGDPALSGSTAAPAAPLVSMERGGANEVGVTFWHVGTETPTDSAFMITAFC